MRFLATLLSLFLVGCTSTYSITATPLDGSGGPYYGTVETSGKGEFKLDINGKLYQGFLDQGSSGPEFASTGGVRTKIGIAKAPDGSALKCVLRYSDQWPTSGGGACTDNDVRVFVLVIKEDR